jgi:hypothetical protein
VGKKRWRDVAARGSVAALLALVALDGGLLTAADAMGNAPSTCNNRYGAAVTTFILTYPGGTLDVLAHPNSTIRMQTGTYYNVSFVVRTNPRNANNNTLGGTTWYNTDFPGFGDGICYPSQGANSIGPNQEVAITLNGVPHPANFAPNAFQAVYFYFDLPSSTQAIFNIDWSTQLSPQTPTATTVSGTPSSAWSSATSSGTVGGSSSTTSAAISFSSTANSAPESSTNILSQRDAMPLGLAAAMIITVVAVAVIWLRRL